MAIPAHTRKWLEERFGPDVSFDEPMAAHTSLRIGGPADALVAPRNEEDLVDLMAMLSERDIDWFVLGGGTNLLVRDKGIRGVVICLEKGFKGICRTDEQNAGVAAECGGRLNDLCRYAVENGLSGLLFATGIPGTVGGATAMNAGTAAGDMASVISALKVLYPPDRIEMIGRDRLAFSYRGLKWPEAGESGCRNPLILTVYLSLEKGNADHLKNKMQILLAGRRAVQPPGLSAGCIFKNPSPEKSAGELLERAGMKGYAAGDAIVSQKHANFILNRGRATAADMLRLMEIAGNRVLEMFDIQLEPEVRIVGQE